MPGSNPLLGNSSANGEANLKSLPSVPFNESVNGLKSNRPAMERAVTISGLQKSHGNHELILIELLRKKKREFTLLRSSALPDWRHYDR